MATNPSSALLVHPQNREIVARLDAKLMSLVAQGQKQTALMLRKALYNIRRHPAPILTEDEALSIPGVGIYTAREIMKIIGVKMRSKAEREAMKEAEKRILAEQKNQARFEKKQAKIAAGKKTGHVEKGSQHNRGKQSIRCSSSSSSLPSASVPVFDFSHLNGSKEIDSIESMMEEESLSREGENEERGDVADDDNNNDDDSISVYSTPPDVKRGGEIAADTKTKLLKTQDEVPALGSVAQVGTLQSTLCFEFCYYFLNASKRKG